MLTHLLYNRIFENATWILTDKNNIATQYNSQQMEAQVVSAYVAHHNKQYLQDLFYSLPKIDKGGVSVKYLHLGGCVIYRHKKSMVEDVNYDQIFPNYKIECYDYPYQCPDCNYILEDAIKRKDEEPPAFAFCSKCLWTFSSEEYRK